jgi:hypothetical protein
MLVVVAEVAFAAAEVVLEVAFAAAAVAFAAAAHSPVVALPVVALPVAASPVVDGAPGAVPGRVGVATGPDMVGEVDMAGAQPR